VSSVREKIRDDAKYLAKGNAELEELLVGFGVLNYKLAIEELRERASEHQLNGFTFAASTCEGAADYLAARLEGEK
jgi:hypothetical protein